MRRWLVVVSLAIASASPAGCNHVGVNTQVMVVVDAQPGVRSTSETLVVRVYGGPAGTASADLVLDQTITAPASAAQGYPYTVALAPQGRDASRVYRVEAMAFAIAMPDPSHDTPISTVRAVSGFVPDQTVTLRLLLEDACIGTTCNDVGTTCSGGVCVDAHRAVDTLPPWTPDAGMDASIGADGASDAGPDAYTTDAWQPIPDAWMPDAHRCTQAECDDTNPCTDDVCSGVTGLCTHTDNTVACDDGMFCDGADQCASGACTVHSGNPCTGTTTCDESTHGCLNCTSSTQCPAMMTGAWGACSFADACTLTGMQMRTVTTYACTSGSCVPSTRMDTQSCSRGSTDGASCGSTTCGAYGPCAPTASPLTYCGPQGGTEMRTCTDAVCMGGSCGTSPRVETGACIFTPAPGVPCSDGNPCTSPDTCVGLSCTGPVVCDAGGDGGMDASLAPCLTMPTLCPLSLGPCAMCAPAAPGADSNGCVLAPCNDGSIGLGDT